RHHSRPFLEIVFMFGIQILKAVRRPLPLFFVKFALLKRNLDHSPRPRQCESGARGIYQRRWKICHTSALAVG
ncbi:MAG: hypothetical protein KIG59_08620, partial [Muribaculaceae bacterium]|nr:hypothetical protein [Muribaculaceae bacterium]